MLTRPSLGLVMILRNEEANLGRSLAPVARHFDEVVVVDTGSRDATSRLCAEMGARVYDLAWKDDFAAARNHSIARARADWLFWLDGDNAITPRAVSGLRKALPGEGPAILWAKEKVEPSGEELWQKRCFARRPGVRFLGRVHEQLAHPPDWPQRATQVVVRHWGYQDPTELKDKGRYYLGLLEQTLAESPGDFYARFQAARCHQNLREFDRAIVHLEAVVLSGQARKINPQIWASAHYLLAQALDREGRKEAAVHLLNRLLGALPAEGLAHYHRGRLAHSHGDWARARIHLERSLALGLGAPMVDLAPKKTLFLANYLLGRSLEKLGRPLESAAAYARALEVDPAKTAARVDRARVLWALAQSEEARAELEQVLTQRPGDRSALHLLATWEEAA